jgi:hypothetical protein
MELITDKIGEKLEELIQNAFESIKDLLIVENKRINHINIYHKNWTRNLHESMILELGDNYNIDTKKIISMGFICSQINSHNQHFHIDYNGDTETYFIPMIDLDDKNGTEYVEFINKEYNIDLFTELLDITNLYIDKEQIISHFEKKNILPENYKFKFLNGEKGCMVKMPYYLFHRGQSNKGTQSRVMFQIIVDRTDKAKICTGVVIEDSELDEETHIINKLLNSRKMND